ncbi:hypothetical protein OGAPHI_005535 [Ogataea philodendri]|uniref:PH domain-containing protein n=1 Tax=Ogataea philodendri TaxID=1378263 RepID=A0A9P8T1U7_9ASCO|nr:uncharacterized protein OGAPHI_005535 [Ogataea philodendri]KAH3662285.1 hypothetical protein OGAPHI_005535 [Ogataea philodendri]
MTSEASISDSASQSLYDGSIESQSTYFGQADFVDVSNKLLAFHTKILPADNYNSPYYSPLTNTSEPKPIDKLINRFSIWKMIIKQLIFYFKEISIFKKQTYLGNKAMLENLELLKKQTNGKLKFKGSASKALRGSLSNNSMAQSDQQNAQQESMLNKFVQTSFLPVGDLSVLSISTTLSNYHSSLAEKELITHNQLTLKIIPRLENLKESLNETIKQIASLKGSDDFKTSDLKYEIAKTGAVLADYITSVELLTKGETTTCLGTHLKFTKLEPKKDPYLLRLKLDLQLKDQLYTEAQLKESYYDIQHKGVQLENILYTEVQNCVKNFVNLINTELDAVKDNMVSEFMNGFLKNDFGIDWDYFILNDNAKNLLKVNAKDSIMKVKQIRKKSDVQYPYQKERISSCLLSGFLEKKSKYLKNYSKFFYVLTFNFIHEFKTEDRKKERHPLNSYSLNDMKVSASPDDARKFVIRISSNRSTDFKTKFTFKSPSPEITAMWLDHLSDLCSLQSPLERNSPANTAAIAPSYTPSVLNMSTAGDAASSFREDSGSISGESSSNLKAQLENNNISSSSLHLPTFQSVKKGSPQETPAPAAHHRRGGSTSSIPASSTSFPALHRHHSSGSSTSQASEGLSIHSTTPTSPPNASNGVAKIVINSETGATEEPGDYFNYTAPRPRVAKRVSSGKSTPPGQPQGSQILRPSSPSHLSQARQPPAQRATSPNMLNKPNVPSFLGGHHSASASQLSPINSLTSMKSASSLSVPSKTGLVRGREKLQAQLKKAASNSNQTNLNGAILEFGSSSMGSSNSLKLPTPSGLPQTPGILPSNSIGDVFPGSDTPSRSVSSSSDPLKSPKPSSPDGYF